MVVTCLGFLFLLTGCFEIVEDVTLRRDGSGTFKVVANLSQSKTQLKSVMLLDSINGYPVPKEMEIDRQMRKAAEAMAQTSGISSMSVNTDFENFIFTMSCEFDNIQTLNQAIEAAAKHMHRGKDPLPKIESFRFVEGTFERIGKYTTAKVFSQLNQQDKAAFEGANYVAVYRFENEVSTISNPSAKKSANGKTVFLKLPIEDLLLEKSNLSNSIQLLAP